MTGDALDAEVEDAWAVLNGARRNGKTHAREVLDAYVAERERAAAEKALTDAADKWQWGAWAVLTKPIKADDQPQRIIGAAQAVTDWLRARAERGAQ